MTPFIFIRNSKLYANFFPEEPEHDSYSEVGLTTNWKQEKYYRAKAEAIASGLEVSNPEIIFGKPHIFVAPELIMNGEEGELYHWPGLMVKEDGKFKLLI